MTNERELYGTEDARPEDECFPPTLFACANMEVEGNVEEDRQVEVNMFEAGEDMVVGYVGRAEEGARCDDDVESREKEDGGDAEEGGEGDRDSQIGGTREADSDDDKSNESAGEQESEDDGEVTRPQHRIRNAIDSDEEQLVDLLNGVDGEAPMDDKNPLFISLNTFVSAWGVL